MGAANIGAGLFQGLAAGGGLSQTAVNDVAGARTQLAGAVTAGLTVLTLLFLTGLFEPMPQATLGAVVIVAAAGLVDVHLIRALGRIRGAAAAFAVITVARVLALGVLDGVLIGVIASMVGLVWALNSPDLVVLGRDPQTGTWRDPSVHANVEAVPGVLVARIIGPVYFANAAKLQARLVELVDVASERPAVLVLDLVAVGDSVVTTLLRLPALDRDLAERGVTCASPTPTDDCASSAGGQPTRRASVNGCSAPYVTQSKERRCRAIAIRSALPA